LMLANVTIPSVTSVVISTSDSGMT
jgi:hypothetical protein